MRDTLGGYPYDIKKTSEKVILSFYPKGKDLKHPDVPKFTLTLDKNDLKKLSKVC